MEFALRDVGQPLHVLGRAHGLAALHNHAFLVARLREARLASVGVHTHATTVGRSRRTARPMRDDRIDQSPGAS